MRLLKEDLARLGEKTSVPQCTWTGYCAAALNVKNADQHKEQILEAHLLLAFFYAMQPGAFSFSAADLLGALPIQTHSLYLMGPNETTLYPSLPTQMKSTRSFASQLKKICDVRRDNDLASAELIDVPNTPHRNVLLLIHRLKKSSTIQILAINFGKTDAQESIEMPQFRQTTAINLMTGLAENKPLDSSSFLLNL